MQKNIILCKNIMQIKLKVVKDKKRVPYWFSSVQFAIALRGAGTGTENALNS